MTVGDWIIGAAALVAALATLFIPGRKAIRAIRGMAERVNRMIDVVLGTPPMPDPDRPGEYLRPGTDDMGVRMARVEDAVKAAVSPEVFATRAQKAAEQAEQAAVAAAQSARASEKATHTAQDAQSIAERAAEAAQKAQRDASTAAADAAKALETLRQITNTH